MASQQSNIYAVAVDAVDLALDTAGTIVGGMAHLVGIGNSDKEERKDADDSVSSVAPSPRQKADAAKPRSHKAKAGHKGVKTMRSKARKGVKTETKRRVARKVA